MTQPKSLSAYSECEEYFERALNSPTGIAVRLETQGLAIRFMQKMNTYRQMLRRQTRAVYPAEDPRHGACPYDHFKLTADPADTTRVLIKPYRMKVLEVETLPQEEE